MAPVSPPLRSPSFRSRARQLPVEDLTQAPPNFPVGQSQAVFCDILGSTAELTLDVTQQQSRVKATVELNQPEAGYPVLDLVPEVQRVVVDGKELPPSAFAEITDPDGVSRFR